VASTLLWAAYLNNPLFLASPASSPSPRGLFDPQLWNLRKLNTVHTVCVSPNMSLSTFLSCPYIAMLLYQSLQVEGASGFMSRKYIRYTVVASFLLHS